MRSEKPMLTTSHPLAQDSVSIVSVHDDRQNRAQRRKFKGFICAANVLITGLIPAQSQLPFTVASAVLYLRARGAATCFCCQTIVSRKLVGAYLTALALSRDRRVAISALCESCWTRAEIGDAERILRLVLPGGRFLDPLPPQSPRPARAAS